jgi:hypothetical protein
MEIEAKVAAVLTPFEIALNVGGNAGVTEGCLVTAWNDVEVVDPDTGAPLGAVRLSKLSFTVKLVEAEFSTAVTNSVSTNFGSTSLLWSFAKQKRMATKFGKEDDPVSVKVGEVVTVYLADDEDGESASTGID